MITIPAIRRPKQSPSDLLQKGASFIATPELHARLRFATRQVKKVYLALCTGTVARAPGNLLSSPSQFSSKAPHPRTLEAGTQP